MKKFLLFLACFGLANAQNYADIVQKNSNNIWGNARFENAGQTYESGFAPIFMYMQSNDYFAWLAAFAIMAVVFAFVLHYVIVGPKHFSHAHGKILAFNKFERLFHLVAAISWVILVPTGLIMMFGDVFGGGFFVRVCKNLHGLATVTFAFSVLPMLFCWFYRMLPALYDIKWMMIVGGYLSKKKRAIPAGKFNAGQKAWFWIATLGGLVMIITGAAMYFLDFSAINASAIFGISQIEFLRASVIVHNVLGAVCAVFLCVHIYMAVFAIKGAIHSMISGYKEEEEVYVLHHYWYRELLDKKKIEKSEFEEKYERL